MQTVNIHAAKTNLSRLLEAVANGEEVTIAWRAAAAVANLPPIHRDPFDRILVAQAVAQPVHLLTADRALLPYSDRMRLAQVR